MPKSVFGKEYKFLPQTELLSVEDISRLTRLFVAYGIEKIRHGWRATAAQTP